MDEGATPNTANDNQLRVVSDNGIDRDRVEDRFNAAFQSLIEDGVDPALVLEASFSTLIDHVYRGDSADPACASSTLFERYNQLQRLSGDLDILIQIMLDRYAKAACRD